MKGLKRLGAVAVGALSTFAAVAASAAPALPEGWTAVGKISPRSAAQLRAAGLTMPISIGTETTDRGFSTYRYWAPYVGPLGAPTARVQSGWAPHERRPGVYDFSTLDEIVDGLRAQSVQPWVDLVYGNPIYKDGGGITLGAGLPEGEGRAAWLRFVERIVTHYSGPRPRVTEWEIWNEPDGGSRIPPEKFADFAIETARVIKRVQPQATIVVAGFTSQAVTGEGTWGYEYARTIVERFDAAMDASVADRDIIVTYHPYHPNPDMSYGQGFEDFRKLVDRAGFRVRQGENGAPSINQAEFALNQIAWDEDGQAKYALRRLLGDYHRGIETSLFTLVDLHYRHAKNTKGLLLTGAWDGADLTQAPLYGDQEVKRPKRGYGAVQNLLAVVDNSLQPVKVSPCVAPHGYTVQAYRRVAGGRDLGGVLAIWRSADRPGDNPKTEKIELRCRGFRLGDAPVYADVLTGLVHRPAAGLMTRADDRFTFKDLPLYDSPILIADTAALPRLAAAGR